MAITPLCTNAVTAKARGHKGEVRAIRCKRWSCPHCIENNRRRVIRAAVAGHPTALLTLTLSSKQYPDPDDAADQLKRGLVALRKRIARRFPNERIPFLAVFEKHKSGHPHLHLLIRAKFLPIRMLKRMWEDITGSYQVDIRGLKKSRQAALYVAKYVGKDLSAFPGCKRWWRSHDYDQSLPETEDSIIQRRKWQRHTANFDSLRSALRYLGAEVVNKGRDGFEWNSDPTKPVTIGDAKMLGRSWWG